MIYGQFDTGNCALSDIYAAMLHISLSFGWLAYLGFRLVGLWRQSKWCPKLMEPSFFAKYEWDTFISIYLNLFQVSVMFLSWFIWIACLYFCICNLLVFYAIFYPTLIKILIVNNKFYWMPNMHVLVSVRNCHKIVRVKTH